MSVARNLGRYVKEKGYNLSEVARRAGLDYKLVYSSLYDEDRGRDLRAEELVPLCAFLNVDPRMFLDDDAKVVK